MITITVGSAQDVANIPASAHELLPAKRMSISAGTIPSKTAVGVVVGAGVQMVTLATRPVAIERAQKTQRLNQALEIGFVPPLQSTSTK